ncbi:MAG: NAD-dependent epimerase/dehydratase family protein [Gammaproteobacteria bacterium]|nr:NAD-dependent epimerase/dehydratase family protein [Gammaproteobacteria bacterium]
MENSKIAVTGGAGFLGSHVVKQLLEKNNTVTVLDDFSNGKMAHLEEVATDPRLTIIRGDITNPEDVSRAFCGCEIIIHLAVLDLRQSIKEPRRVNQVIVDGTMNCLEAAQTIGVKLFLNCSSSEAYGTASYVPMDEKHPLHPETPYAAAKVAQDMYVYSYGRTYNLPWTTIRPFNMYGSNSHWQGFRGELIPKMIVRAMNQTPLVIFGNGEQTRDFLYVEEAARALIDVADNPASHCRCLNFCTGVETSVKRIAELICEHFSLDPKKFIQKQPSRPGDVMRHLGDNTAFKEITGYTPTVGIEEGIRRTIDWLQTLPFTPEQLLSSEVLRNWE